MNMTMKLWIPSCTMELIYIMCSGYEAVMRRDDLQQTVKGNEVVVAYLPEETEENHTVLVMVNSAPVEIQTVS